MIVNSLPAHAANKPLLLKASSLLRFAASSVPVFIAASVITMSPVATPAMDRLRVIVVVTFEFGTWKLTLDTVIDAEFVMVAPSSSTTNRTAFNDPPLRPRAWASVTVNCLLVSFQPAVNPSLALVKAVFSLVARVAPSPAVMPVRFFVVMGVPPTEMANVIAALTSSSPKAKTAVELRVESSSCNSTGLLRTCSPSSSTVKTSPAQRAIKPAVVLKVVLAFKRVATLAPLVAADRSNGP